MTDEQRPLEVPAGRILAVAPGLPCTDMARTVEHYERLGFTFGFPGASSPSEADFAIAQRDGIELHFVVKPDHDPARTATWVYLRVEDADELAAELAAAAGQGRPVRDTDYSMRELAHIDPDGNLLLFGSPLPRDQEPRDQEPRVQQASKEQPSKEQPSEQQAGGAQPGGAQPSGAQPGGALPSEELPGEVQPRERPPGQQEQLRVLAESERAAFELLRAIKRGDAERLAEILAADPGLARCLINGVTPLHHFADAPGHRPNAAAMVTVLVAAGADLDAHVRDTWHHETPLHWAASNDDVALIDVLIDAGADIEHPGSSIGGGPPIQSALGYAQWAAVRRLWQRGAQVGLSHAAVLGLMDMVASLVDTTALDGDEVSIAFWNACRAGQLESARYLLAHGADLNWPAPWDGSTPLDAATAKRQRETVAWLRASGAQPGTPA
ncbi:MAG TPA: ankyrin repeat domain-containing protein [Trebonia sp.]|nr:ankyrin repeat domain-containing protein [Trebonia sp.]